MTYVSKIEEIYDTLQTFITSNIETVLTAYYAVDDTVLLPNFQRIDRGDFQVTDLKIFPGIIVKPGQVQINPSGYDKPLQKDFFLVTLSLWLVYKGTSIALLQRQGERYAWAVKEIIDSSTYTPTAAILQNAIRRVIAIDWGMVEHTNTGKIAAAFVDVELEVLIQRN